MLTARQDQQDEKASHDPEQPPCRERQRPAYIEVLIRANAIHLEKQRERARAHSHATRTIATRVARRAPRVRARERRDTAAAKVGGDGGDDPGGPGEPASHPLARPNRALAHQEVVA